VTGKEIRQQRKACLYTWCFLELLLTQEGGLMICYSLFDVPC
jgi:hypothetical protein